MICGGGAALIAATHPCTLPSLSTACSRHSLVGVDPFDSLSKDSAICCILSQVGLWLEEFVRGLELAPVESRTVTNHDLGGVLVGHHDSRLRELGANCVWVVWHKRLLGHPNVEVGLLSVGLSCKQKDKNKWSSFKTNAETDKSIIWILSVALGRRKWLNIKLPSSSFQFVNIDLLGPGLNFRGAGCVLVGGGCLPASLLERELHCNGLSILFDDVRAGLHASVSEERGRFIHLCVPEGLSVVKCPAWIQTRQRSCLGSVVDGWAEWVLARLTLWHVLFFLVLAFLSGSSREYTSLGSCSRSLRHQVQN